MYSLLMISTTGKRLVLLFLVTVMFGASVFASRPGTFDRTLTVTGPVALDVRSDPGGVYIRTGATANVVVHALIKPLYGRLDFDVAEANIRALEKDPPIEQTGNNIRIGFPKDSGVLRAVTIRYEIEVPRTTQVHAQTESGGISIDGITGPVEAVTSSGGTQLSNIEGAIRVTGHSGEVTVRGVRTTLWVRNDSGGVHVLGVGGNADIETTRGRIEISQVGGDVHAATQSASIRIEDVKGSVEALNRSGSVDAHRLSGAVHAETTSGAIGISQVSAAPIRAMTRSGAVKVELASGAGYQLDARSDSGKISGRATIGFTMPKDSHRLSAKVGSGGPLVNLNTHSSRIVID